MGIIRYFLILLFFFCFGFSNTPLSAAEDPETVTLQLKWFHQYQFAGYYAAKEKGFYAEEGLNVVLKERDPDKGYVQAVLDGDAAYGTADAGLLLDRVKGKPVVVLKQIFQHSPLVFLSLKTSGITGPDKMVDKKVMFKPEEDAPLLAMLLETLGSLKKIRTVPFSFDYEDLVAGKADIISAYITNEPFYFEQRNIPINVFNPQNYGIDFYGDNLFATEEEIKYHPERVRKMIRATLKGWEYALAHPEEIIDLIINKYNAELSREKLAYEARMTHQMILPGITPLGTVTPQRYEQIVRIYESVGLTKLPVDLCAFIYRCPDYTKHPSGLSLTPEERAWIHKHPVVRARIGNAPPLHFFDGKFRGISVDYLDLIAKRAGFKVQYVTDIPWSKALDDIKKHETIDLLLTAKVTPERRRYMAFTKDYLLMPWVIFTQKDRSIGSMENLTDKIVAVERDFVMHKKLAAEYPHIKLLVKGTSREAIEAVATGEADGYIGNLTTGVYIIRKNNLNNVKVAASTPFGGHDQAMAIRDDWPELAGIIDKGLASISEKEQNQILTGYPGILSPEGSVPQKRIDLTEQEDAWLKEHPVIRVHNENSWPPFNYFGHGSPRGLSIDYMNLLAERLGVTVKYITGPNWNEFLKMIQRKELDVMLNMVKTEDRLKYVLFTEPYFRNPNAIVSSEKRPFETIEQLFGKTVAFPKGFFFEEVLTKSFPGIKRLPVEDSLAGLKAVTFGKADAALGEDAVVRTLISKNMLSGLQISGEVKLGNPDLVKLRIGVRDDWPLLQSVIMKAMADITPQEMNQLRRKWLVKLKDKAQKAPLSDKGVSIGRLILYGAAIFVFIILLSWFVFKKSSKKGIAAGFGSTRFRLIVLFGLTFFVIVILLTGWFSLSRIKSDILQAVGKNLSGTLLIAKKGLGLWEAERRAFMKHLGDDPKLVAPIEQLLKAPPDRKALEASEPLREVRNYFKENRNIFPNIGFFIISPEDISIGSARDTNLGTFNLISRQYPEIIKRAFEGHVGFVPPVESNIQLGKASKSNVKKAPTMFFIGPIQRSDGKIIAVMTLRVDPSKDFSRIMGIVGGHGTEETYAFTEEGRLISNSKFDEQLQQIGLIGEGEKAVMNIEIRDPGVNMVKGDRPLIERPRQPLTRMAAGAIALKSRMEAMGAHYGHSEIETDMAGYRDYRGVPVFGAWVWDANLGLGIGTEIDVDDALSSYYRIRAIILFLLGLAVILFVGGTLFLLRMGERTHRVLTRATDNLEEKVEERTTELREKQEQLSIAEERSRLLLDSAGEGIFGVNREGSCTFANPAALGMLGYTQDEIVGKDIHFLIHHTHSDGSPYPAEGCPMSRAYTHGETETISDEMLWRKDGAGFSVEYMATPILKGEKITGAVITFRNITERKQMEEELHSRITELNEAQSAMRTMMEDLDKEKQKAEDATQAKSHFLANMSHEIRTPMNAIMGMSHLALNTDLNPRQRDYVNKIQSSAKALLGIINDILDFSKIEAGKLDIEEIDFSLDDVLENVSNLIGVKSQEKGLELLFDTGRDAPVHLVGDPLRLGQVLTNLGNNAVKFTEKGEVVIRTELVEQKGEQVQLRFTVKDSGIGLTQEQQGKLFQAFSQADASTTRKYGGTGLGLTISKRLVNMMGGEIRVESVAGEGAAFIFTVVFGMGQAKEKSALVPAPDLMGLKVLVVDDNATSREILQGMLTSMTFETTMAASALEGLEMLEEADSDQPFDLVIMDWKMPGMDGLTASRKIRDEPALKTSPRIIMVTAYGREEIMKQAEHFGLDGFLTKPLGASLLFDTIMAAFGQEARRDSRISRQDSGMEDLSGIRGARVLLAEDNEINQQVAREILEGAGLVVDIAEDGEKAVEAVAENPYDVVLMDIQMPLMDGYEATRHIRDLEIKAQSSRLKRKESDELSASSFQLSARPGGIPIIAMTANAMAGDREKAIDAGMNDHVAKPIDVKVLFSTLLRFIKPGERESAPETADKQKNAGKEEESPLPVLAGIDASDGLARVGGNQGFYRKILKKFRVGNLGVMEKIRKEVARKDLDQAERLVHGVKGASGNIGATDLFESARILDEALKLEKTEELETMVETFSTALEVALGSIAELEALEEKSAKDVSGGPITMDMNRVKEIMARLKELLEDDDAEAANVLDSLKDQLRVPEAQLYLQELASQIGGYDFEEAIGSLNELAGVMKIDL